MSTLKRHTLCWVAQTALSDIAKQFELMFCSLPADIRHQALATLLSGALPGIVRRGAHTTEEVPLGFSFPLRWLGQRLRLAVNVPVRAIVRYSTPEQTARLPLSNRTTATRAFNRLRESGCWQELRMGVWGSVALEMVTPWQWTDNHSDLDIQIMPESLSSIAQCLETLRHIEHHYQLRIDGEILLSNGYAINIKEWFSGSLTLLAKGENDVQLITRQDVIKLSKTSFN